MKNEERFKELLKEAIGDRTQNEFSLLTGIAVAQLSRYIRGKATYLPKPETLEKIANASEGRVKLSDLMECCGHEMEKYKEKKKNTPDHITARDDIKRIQSGLEAMCGMRIMAFDTLRDPLYFAIKDGEYKVKEERKCSNDIDPNAEKYAFVTVERTLSENRALYVFIITYNRTEGGGIILSKCITDGKTMLLTNSLEEIVQAGFDDQEKDTIKTMDAFFFLTPTKELSEAEQNRLRSGISKLVGERHERYIGAVIGIGFTLSDFMDDEAFKAFLIKHKSSLSKAEQKDIEPYITGRDDHVDEEHIACHTTGCCGKGAYISNIMTKEIGFPVAFWSQTGEDFLFNNNPDCILLSEDELAKADKGFNWAMEKIEPYARELGIRSIGTQYFQAVFDKEQGIFKVLD